MKNVLLIGSLIFGLSGCSVSHQESKNQISGIYPKLAFYNNEGECGTGAVVPWAGRLWAITYGPHLPFGSSDKLYEITPDKQQFIRSESIGGTPANRMIHKESNQLNIGPYFIDSLGNVRVIPWQDAPGRYTGSARHLTDPENQIYIGTMEEGFYEINVHNLEAKELYKDGNEASRLYRKNPKNTPKPVDLLPGAHGKGLYSGQGVLIYANNGENSAEAMSQFDALSGSLSEWNGKEWKLIRRNQFTEITGPGGIYGNEHPETDPIWTTGWDHKSVLLGVRDAKSGWTFYRLPKASHSYDGAHGWNTEWPRIRNIGSQEKPDYLMTMHGMFWKFPASFTKESAYGIRPRSAYLKVIGDFTRWNDELVFGCDDSAQKEFLNKRKAKGNLEGAGQSNSNLWFTSLSKPDELGPTTADGALWQEEEIKGGVYSDPFLFAGWDKRCCWIKNEGNEAVVFSFETDLKGDNNWKKLKEQTVAAGQSCYLPFSSEDQGEWIRVKTNKDTKASVVFNYAEDLSKRYEPSSMFNGLSSIHQEKNLGGLLHSLGNGRKSLGVLPEWISEKGTNDFGYYEMFDSLALDAKNDSATASNIREKCNIPQNAVLVDQASVFITDDKGRRWRLPMGDARYTDLIQTGSSRICREVITERDLFNCHGTFYELPAENADGYAKIRPICSHSYWIHDYASYRGMLIMTGINLAKTDENNHIITANDGKSALWAGVIDDLWNMGKPVGVGGPWKNTVVEAGTVSDPYLIGFYDQKTLSLSHDAKKPVTFTIETDPTGNGVWFTYQSVTVQPGETFTYEFESPFEARWIRFRSDSKAHVTAWLEYQ